MESGDRRIDIANSSKSLEVNFTPDLRYMSNDSNNRGYNHCTHSDRCGPRPRAAFTKIRDRLANLLRVQVTGGATRLSLSGK